MNGRRFALVRHPTPEVARGICYGRLDVGLAPASTAELANILCALDGFGASHIWTSPAIRCRSAAVAIAAALAVPLREDPRLLELDFGAWEGQPWADVPREALDRWAAAPEDFAPPDGERGRDFLARITSFADDLHREGEDAVIVSHGGPLKILAALLSGRTANLLDPAPPLASVTIVTAQRSSPWQ